MVIGGRHSHDTGKKKLTDDLDKSSLSGQRKIEAILG